jgi:hypothetical protein
MTRKMANVITLILTFGVCTPAFAIDGGALAGENITITIPPAANATTEVQSPAAVRFINMLIDLLAAVLLILVPYFVHRLLAYFETKTKIKLSPEIMEKINALLDKGIAYGEEQAHKAIKNSEKALTMSEKLEHGASYVMDLADKSDIKNWSIEKIKKMLEARLQEKRANNS